MNKRDTLNIKKALILLIITLLMGCASKETHRVDSKENHLTTIRWGENDLQEMANSVVSSILSSSTIDFSKNYAVGKITNRSHDHIDTKNFSHKIITSLLQSGRVKMVKEKNSSAIFFGKISSIFKKSNRTKDMFFNFNLTLIDSKTSQVIWSHDVPIRKIQKRALFGW
jgi:PBP1b-binding outer membrane lipoprotein LpoB